MNIDSLLSWVGITSGMTQDVIVVVSAVVLSLVYGAFAGKYRLMAALASIYISFSLINVVPEKIFDSYEMEILSFFILFVGLTTFNKSFFNFSFNGIGTGFLWRVFLMSFLQVVLILSIVASMAPKGVALEYVSKNIYNYLVSGWAQFCWMVAPLAYIFFARKRMGR